MDAALWGFVPLVAYTVVEAYYGLQPAVVIAIALALIEVAWTRWRQGRVPRMPALSAGLVVVLGGLSLLSDDPTFVLVSPVVGDLVFAGVLAGSVWLGRGLLVTALAEQEPDRPVEPPLARFLDAATLRTAAVLVAHAALTAWSIPRERAVWTFVSGPLQYALLGVQLAGEVAWARWRVLPALDALSEPPSHPPPP
ncbi:MAG TPA: septation protein IspZ [Myxococcota bacterium]|nr:septation protein IspZ [Myxococcota bacterium]